MAFQPVRIALVLAILATPATADTRRCADGGTLVMDAGNDAARICDMVEVARTALAACGGLNVPEELSIHIRPDLGAGCLGMFHCGEDRIELLSPDALRTGAAGSTGLLSGVVPDLAFESVLRHELVHAALDRMPCPFDDCSVAQEYVAYALQIEFLPAPVRDRLVDNVPGLDRPVSRDGFSEVMLMMAPDVFGVSAWVHFRERPDPCGFLGQVSRGEVLLDRERF